MYHYRQQYMLYYHTYGPMENLGQLQILRLMVVSRVGQEETVCVPYATTTVSYLHRQTAARKFANAL